MRVSLLVFFICLPACDAVILRQPTLPNVSSDAQTAPDDYKITALSLTTDVASRANQAPFRELIIYSADPRGPIRLLSPEDVIRANPPPSGDKEDYLIGPGDVLQLDRLQYVINADGIETEEVISRQLRVGRNGRIALADGSDVSLANLTIEEAREAIASALEARTDRLARDIVEIPLPTQRVPEYTVGIGDVLAVRRLVRVSEAGEFTTNIVTQTSPVNLNGSINILDIGSIEVEGLTLDELTDVVSQEALRAGLSSEIIVEVQSFNSQSAVVTGELGTRLVPITSQPLTLDRLLIEVNPNLMRQRDYLVIVERNNEVFQMRARRILLEEDRDKYPIFDGDRIIIERLAQSPTFQLSVTEFHAQIVTYTTVGQSGLNEAVIDDQGLDLRRLVGRTGKQLSRDQDALIRLFRDGREYRLSLQELLLDTSQPQYWLHAGDHVIIEDLIYSRSSALIIGSVGRPTRLPLSAAQRTTLAQALFQGQSLPRSDADFSHIYVLRGADDTYTAYHLDLRDVTRATVAENFELRPGDIVYVDTRPISKLNEVLRLALGLASGATTIGSLVTPGQDTADQPIEEQPI